MKTHIVILLILALLTCVFTFPAILHLSDKLIGDGYDNYQMFGWQYVANQQIENGSSLLGRTNYWRYPVGVNFSQSFDSLVFVTTGIMLYRFIENPVIVFNLSILIIIYLGSICSYVYFKKISDSSLLGILGSIIYSFSFYVLARLEAHMNLIFVGCFPLLLYSILVLLEKFNKKNLLLFSLSIILIYSSSLAYLTILMASAIVLTPIILIAFKEEVLQTSYGIFKNKSSVLLCAFVVFITLNLLFTSDVTDFMHGEIPTKPLTDVALFSANVSDYFWPLAESPLMIKRLLNIDIKTTSIEHSVFLGFIEMLIFILLLTSTVRKKIKLSLIATIIILFILSLGCKESQGIYCTLYSHYPFRAISEPGRFYVILYLIFTTGIIYYLKNIKRYKYFFYLVITSLVIIERLPSGFMLSKTNENEKFLSIARNLESNAILDLPIIVDHWGQSQALYNVYSVFYQKPVVNGTIHWRANKPETHTFINFLPSLICPTNSIIDTKKSQEILQLLTVNKIKTVVYHKNPQIISSTHTENCDLTILNMEIFIDNSISNLGKKYEDANVIVYHLK